MCGWLPRHDSVCRSLRSLGARFHRDYPPHGLLRYAGRVSGFREVSFAPSAEGLKGSQNNLVSPNVKREEGHEMSRHVTGGQPPAALP